MHVNKTFVPLLMFSVILFSCKTKQETVEQPVKTIDTTTIVKKDILDRKDEPPPVSYNYIKVVNNRYNFSFEMPESWKAVDKSNNGDGFYLDAGDINVDFRIYGETLTGIDDIDSEGISCDAVAEYVFADGTKGTKCTDNGLLYFFYPQKKKRVNVYINAPIEWKKKNINAINHIAESVSMKTPA
ncbi:MAG: hypothetical protein ACKVPJ_11750 [Chitinophagales bacterium]